MKTRRVTLKFSHQEFDALRDDFHRLECKLRAIGHIDLRAISDEVSYGHFLYLEEACRDLQDVLEKFEHKLY